MLYMSIVLLKFWDNINVTANASYLLIINVYTYIIWVVVMVGGRGTTGYTNILQLWMIGLRWIR